MNSFPFAKCGRLAIAALMLLVTGFGCGDDKSTSPKKTPEPVPSLSMAMACNSGLIDFSVTNAGGTMKQASMFIAAYADGHTDTVLVILDKDSTLKCPLSNIHGKVTVTNDEFALQDSCGSCLPDFFQGMMESIDLGSMIPSPLGQTQVICTYSIYLQNLEVGGVSVEWYPNDSGMTLRTTYSDITAHLSAPSPGGLCVAFGGDVSIASVVVVADFHFDDASPQVTLRRPNATINGFHVAVDGFFGGIVSTIIGWIQNSFTDPLEDAIVRAFEDYIGQDYSALVIVEPKCGN